MAADALKALLTTWLDKAASPTNDIVYRNTLATCASDLADVLALGERQETAEPPQKDRVRALAAFIVAGVRRGAYDTSEIEGLLRDEMPCLAAHREGPATADALTRLNMLHRSMGNVRSLLDRVVACRTPDHDAQDRTVGDWQEQVILAIGELTEAAPAHREGPATADRQVALHQNASKVGITSVEDENAEADKGSVGSRALRGVLRGGSTSTRMVGDSDKARGTDARTITGEAEGLSLECGHQCEANDGLCERPCIYRDEHSRHECANHGIESSDDGAERDALTTLMSKWQEREDTYDRMEVDDASTILKECRLEVEATLRALSAHREGRPPAAETLEAIDYEALDPGIRDVVRVLREAGFETSDSGDGVSKPADWYATGCAMSVPNVAAMTTRATLLEDADRMAAILTAIHPDWHVEASYSTEDASYVLLAIQQNEKAAFLSIAQPTGREPASETPVEDFDSPEDPQRTLDSLAAMLGWMNTPPRRTLEQSISALKARSLRPASETGQASAWQPTVLFINERLDHWRKELDPFGVVTPRGVRAVTVMQELEVVRSTLPPLPLAPSEDETTRTER